MAGDIGTFFLSLTLEGFPIYLAFARYTTSLYISLRSLYDFAVYLAALAITCFFDGKIMRCNGWILRFAV